VAKWINLNQGLKLSSFPKGFSVKVSTLTGRGVLIPSDVFRNVGLYDQKHFRQCGDTELPIRAKKNGYKLVVYYDTIVYNLVGSKNHINLREQYKLSDIREYYWGIRSNTNLWYRYWFARGALSSPFWLGRYLICDFLRITHHFMTRVGVKA
jgi:GT2 family glycosyltransferase